MHNSVFILKVFESATIESVLTSCITVWFGIYAASDWNTLQQIVKTAVTLPSFQDKKAVQEVFGVQTSLPT